MRRFPPFLPLLMPLSMFLLSGCVTSEKSYYERYEIRNLTVVFLDEQSLQEKYALLSGRQALEFSGLGSSARIKTVHGFFDPQTNTLYCPKMNFEVCGHELHHAAIGHFHPDP